MIFITKVYDLHELNITSSNDRVTGSDFVWISYSEHGGVTRQSVVSSSSSSAFSNDSSCCSQRAVDAAVIQASRPVFAVRWL